MAHPILGGHTRGQQATSNESLSSLDSSTSERGSTTASSASPSPHFPPGRKTFTAAPGATPATRADADRLAVAQEVHVERPGRPAAAVDDHRDVAVPVGADVAQSQIRPQVGLLADRREHPLGAHRLAAGRPPAEVHGDAVAGGRAAAPGRSCRRCTCARSTGAVIHSPKPSALILRNFGASGVLACSVKRICIFSPLRTWVTWPWKVASWRSTSQVRQHRLAVGALDRVRGGREQAEKGNAEPGDTPPANHADQEPRTGLRVAPIFVTCPTSTGSVRSRTCTNWRS